MTLNILVLSKKSVKSGKENEYMIPICDSENNYLAIEMLNKIDVWKRTRNKSHNDREIEYHNQWPNFEYSSQSLNDENIGWDNNQWFDKVEKKPFNLSLSHENKVQCPSQKLIFAWHGWAYIFDDFG